MAFQKAFPAVDDNRWQMAMTAMMDEKEVGWQQQQ